jgi:SEC-C motif-containing protein
MDQQRCFCGSDKELSACCELIIQGAVPARTPEDAIRARFTAHCRRNYAYLVDSTHPEHRDGVTEQEIAQWASHVTWTALEIHSSLPGETDDQGTVSFTAHFSLKGVPQTLREDASFARHEGGWYYVDGHIHGQPPYVREQRRTGRNEACPCGSGKKFKKCCGR